MPRKHAGTPYSAEILHSMAAPGPLLPPVSPSSEATTPEEIVAILNQEMERLNATIQLAEQKLAALNLGVTDFGGVSCVSCARGGPAFVDTPSHVRPQTR